MFSLADSFDHWLNRKNCCALEMGLVTVFCPLATTGPGETVVQTADETTFVVDCKVNPATLVGHVKITFASKRITVSCGRVTGNERLNTVPSPKSPPPDAVPYRVLPDKIKLAKGVAPSLPPLKSCSVVKPVPSVLMANTVPLPELPPSDAVP